jgi:hypothetical protein
MAQQIINVGTNPNDGTGDTLRGAFIKTDDNFTELYSGKQNTLISGTNIKTINSTSLLGSGNVSVQATLVSGTNIKTINGNSILGSGDLTISGGITGSGTDNYIPRFNGTTALENSIIYDDGTNVGIGTSSPSTTLQVLGTFKAGDFSNPSLDVGASEISANVDSNKIILNSSSAKLGNYGSGVELGVNAVTGARVYFENSIGNKFGLQESDNLLVTDNGLIQDTVTPSDATTPVKWIRINDIASGDQFLLPVYA